MNDKAKSKVDTTIESEELQNEELDKVSGGYTPVDKTGGKWLKLDPDSDRIDAGIDLNIRK